MRWYPMEVEILPALCKPPNEIPEQVLAGLLSGRLDGFDSGLTKRRYGSIVRAGFYDLQGQVQPNQLPSVHCVVRERAKLGLLPVGHPWGLLAAGVKRVTAEAPTSPSIFLSSA